MSRPPDVRVRWCRPGRWCSDPQARCCSCTVRSTTTGRSPRAERPRRARDGAAIREVAGGDRAADTAGSTPPDQRYPVGRGRNKTVALLDRSGRRRRRRERLRAQPRDRRGRVVPDRQGQEPAQGPVRRLFIYASSPDPHHGGPATQPGPLPQGVAGRRPRAAAAGDRQAPGEQAGAGAGGYDARSLVSSTSLRCVQTLGPYVVTWSPLRTDQLLSEEDASRKVVAKVLANLLDGLRDRPASAGGPAVCTHRPVLPWLFDAPRA